MQSVNALPASACFSLVKRLSRSFSTRKAGICNEVVQGLCVALPSRFGDGWQGLPFDLGKHPNMEVFEVLKAPHIWKHILIELTIVINKGHGRSGWSCLRHPFLPPLLTEL